MAELDPAEAELVRGWARADIARNHTFVPISDDKAVSACHTMAWQCMA